MAFKVTARVNRRDIAKLTRTLYDLDKRTARNALKRGIRQGSKLIWTEARRRAPRRFGLLKKSIGARIKVYKRGKVILAVIGPRRGFKRLRPQRARTGQGGRATVTKARFDDPVKYAHLVELGTVHSKPRPFLRPAWASRHHAALDLIAGVLAEAIRSHKRG